LIDCFFIFSSASDYKLASEELKDDRIYKTPNSISNDGSLSWKVSFWYWGRYVHVRPGVQEGKFGDSTRRINGDLECDNGKNVHVAKIRFGIYKKVFKALKINGTPEESGCYN
jgi:hypothetical protein